MPLDHTPNAGIHETIIVLPDGRVHAQGLLQAATEPLEVLIGRVSDPLRAAARRQEHPILLSIGHADGRVEQHQISADGSVHPTDLRPDTHAVPDQVWSQGIPEDTRILDHVRAAQRAGQWRAAQLATHRATQHLVAEHGRQHPYVALGIELQAHFALMAQDFAAAAALSTEAALAIHRLDGPPAQIRHGLANAVAAWIHSDRDTRPSGPGFALAHALIRITPDDQASLSALLRRLDKKAGRP